MSNPRIPFASFSALPPDHLFRSWPPEAPPWQMARHYFADPSLRNVRAQWSKFCSVRETPETSDGAVAEAAWLAEMEAYWVLTKGFRFVATGFEVASPRRTNQGDRCDLGGHWDGEEHYVEVKRRAREDRELVPPKVHEVLAALQNELGFELTPTILDGGRRFNDEVCSRLRNGISEHVARWKETYERDGLHFPGSPSTYRFEGLLEVRFWEPRGGSYQKGQFFDPLTVEEVELWLFGNPGVGRAGMVDAALAKGATVLAIAASSFIGLNEIVNCCFPTAVQVDGARYSVRDPRLGDLVRILVMRKWDEYALLMAG